MKNETSNTSDIVIIVSAVLAATGLLGALLWMKSRSDNKKNIKNQKENLKQKENHRTESSPEIKMDVCKTVPSTPPMRGSYKTAEDLVSGISIDIIKEKSFSSPRDFLEQLISRSFPVIESYSWYEEIPETIEELEATLKKLGLFEIYSRVLVEKMKI